MWKRFRESKEDDPGMGEEEALAWENVRSSMSELEGGESVERAEEEDRIRIITLRKPVLVLEWESLQSR